MKRAGVVLCGGRSSRMGRAKAWLPWFGQSMIEHVVSRLSGAVDEVVVVTSEALALPPLETYGARVIRDREPERGPLAGIRDGLAALESEAEFAFVTSTDAPFLTADFILDLMARRRACAPLSEGFVQVLSAVYPREAWKTAERLLEEGVGRPLSLLESLDYEGVEVESQTGPPAWHGFNTPAAYLAAVREVDPAATAEVEWTECAAGGEDGSRKVPVGTLGEILARCPPSLGLLAGDRVAEAYRVSLAAEGEVRDLGLPVGPGERVRVRDSADEKEQA